MIALSFGAHNVPRESGRRRAGVIRKTGSVATVSDAGKCTMSESAVRSNVRGFRIARRQLHRADRTGKVRGEPSSVGLDRDHGLTSPAEWRGVEDVGARW